MSRIRFGVIGCGAIASMSHIPALKRCKNAELVAVVDSDKDRLEMVRKRFGIPHAFQHTEKLRGLVDAVLIATPNFTHYAIAKDFLEESIHTLCDKPLALSLSEAQDLYAIAENRHCKLMVSYNRRFSSRIQALHELVMGIESPKSIEISLGGNIASWPAHSAFRFEKSSAGGGCVIDTGVHILDLAIYYLGIEASLREARLEYLQKWEVEDNALIVLQFPEGSVATLSCSYTFGLKPKIKVTWQGGWASTWLDGPDQTVAWYMQESLACRSTGIQHLLTEQNNVYVDQLDHFCRCIIDDASPMVRKEEVLAGHAIIEEVYRRQTS